MMAGTELGAARLDSLPIFSFHRRILWSIGFIFFFELGNINTLSFASPAIIQHWHISVETLGLVISATFFGMFIGAMVGGRLADRVGRKRMLIVTTLWFSVFSLLNALVWDPIGLFIARLLTGIGLSAMTAIGITYVVEMFPAASRGRYHALVVMVGLLGIPATAYVARYVIPLAPWGWRLVFIWGALGLIFPLIARKLEESPRWLEKCGRVEEARATMARIVAAAEAEKGSLPPFVPTAAPLPVCQSGFGELFKPELSGRTFLFIGVWIFQTLGFYGFMSWVPSLLVKHGFSLVNSLAWTSAMQLGAVPGALLAAWLSDKWQRKWWIALVSVVIAVFGLAYGLTFQAETIMIFGFLVTMFIQSFAALNYPYTAESFPTPVRSLGSGFTYGVGRLSNVFGPLIIAYLFTHYGYRSVFIYIAACWLIVAFIVAIWGPRTRGKHL